MKPLVITLPATTAPGCTIEIGPARESMNDAHTQVWLDTGLCPFDELNHDLPDECWVLKHEPTGRYGCYHHEGAHGLCAFLTPGVAGEWAEFIDLPGMGPAKVNQEELLQIAKARPLPINAVHVFDKDVEPAHTFYFR